MKKQNKKNKQTDKGISDSWVAPLILGIFFSGIIINSLAEFNKMPTDVGKVFIGAVVTWAFCWLFVRSNDDM